jgi:hypothetical protein
MPLYRIFTPCDLVVQQPLMLAPTGGIELFFKWIKQNLKIQSFWGFSENAVKTQIWIAISVYVLVLIARKKLRIPNSPYEIIQYISVAPFEKRPIHNVFLNIENQDVKEPKYIQLKII